MQFPARAGKKKYKMALRTRGVGYGGACSGEFQENFPVKIFAVFPKYLFPTVIKEDDPGPFSKAGDHKFRLMTI